MTSYSDEVVIYEQKCYQNCEKSLRWVVVNSYNFWFSWCGSVKLQLK